MVDGKDPDTDVDAGDADDTSQDSDESSSQDDKENSDQDAGGDDSSQFFNPNELPEDLKPVWKRMQGSFTRKMQRLSANEKGARAFQELSRDPDFQQYMAARQRGETFQQYMGRSGKDDDSGDDGDTDTMRAMMRDEIAKALAPSQKRDAEKELATEFKSFTDAHPDWEIYKADLQEELENNPGLTYEKAFKIVTHGDAISLGRKGAAQKLRDKKGANVGKPGTASTGGDKPQKPAKSIMEAYKQAKEQHKGG